MLRKRVKNPFLKLKFILGAGILDVALCRRGEVVIPFTILLFKKVK